MNTSFFFSTMLQYLLYIESFCFITLNFADQWYCGWNRRDVSSSSSGTMAIFVVMFSVAFCYILLYKGKGENGCFGRSWQHYGSHWKGIRHPLGHSCLTRSLWRICHSHPGFKKKPKKKSSFLLIQLLLSFFPLLGQAAGWNISSCGDPRPAYLRISSDWLLASLLVQRHDDEVCGQSGQAYDSRGGATVQAEPWPA